MKGLTKEFLSFLLVLIMAFLLLTHATGFSQDVKAGFGGINTLTKTLQGR